MKTDYVVLRAENEGRYGTDISRIGPMLLADRYADRNHFIFELLQNAENALARRQGWKGRRAVEFVLSDHALRVSHFGIPFTEGDVRGICGIGESINDITSIGRFGIGFKSVYAFTNCPEIYSGEEHFAIESFVWPKEIPPIKTEPGQTVLCMPLREDDPSATTEIASGLQRLDPRTLLFLREIEEISWSVAGGSHGLYRRGKPELLSQKARKVVVIREDQAIDGVTEETWLIFSREVSNADGAKVGYAELAFRLDKRESDGKLSVLAESSSPLVVFFPTILPTHLGFLVQGPYRPTPSRDNVLAQDSWNKFLIKETATLLVEALQELRELGLLNVEALRSLPLDASKFSEGSMFAPLFIAVKEALSTLPLLPTFDGKYTKANDALLARGKELTKFLNKTNIQELFSKTDWLDTNITDNLARDLRDYMIKELKIDEIDFDDFARKITENFLKSRPDEWMLDFYGDLSDRGQATRNILRIKPIIRLETNEHIVPFDNKGEVQVYLPTNTVSEYKTIKRIFVENENSLKFLKELGLKEPDLYAEVKKYILPKYQKDDIQKDEKYYDDFKKLLGVFENTPLGKNAGIKEELSKARFIDSIGNDNLEKGLVRPSEVYFNDSDLKTYFEGYYPVYFISDELYSRFGKEKLKLLKELGVKEVPRRKKIVTIKKAADLSSEEKTKFNYRDVEEKDFEYEGLSKFIEHMTAPKSYLLWKLLLKSIENKSSRDAKIFFEGERSWQYYSTRSEKFDAQLIKILRQKAWLVDRDGNFRKPSDVVLSELSDAYVKESSNRDVLIEALGFKSEIVEQLPEYDRKILEIAKANFITVEEIEELAHRKNQVSSSKEEKTWMPKHEPDSVKVTTTEADPDKIVTPDLTGQAEKMGIEKEDKLPNKGDEPIEEDTPKNQPDLKAIGRWGEECVYLKELRENYQKLGSITETDSGFKVVNVSNEEFEIVWLNKHQDRGKGYDFVIKKNGSEIEYIEVKTKIQTEGVKELVPVTKTQWEFARKLFDQNEGEKYHFYVVSNAGGKNIPIKIFKNPIKLWKEGKLHAHPVNFEL